MWRYLRHRFQKSPAHIKNDTFPEISTFETDFESLRSNLRWRIFIGEKVSESAFSRDLWATETTCSTTSVLHSIKRSGQLEAILQAESWTIARPFEVSTNLSLQFVQLVCEFQHIKHAVQFKIGPDWRIEELWTL